MIGRCVGSGSTIELPPKIRRQTGLFLAPLERLIDHQDGISDRTAIVFKDLLHDVIIELLLRPEVL